MRAMIIAIDGPAGVGKSTVARRVAAELGVPFLDTGAMYRAVTLVVLERGLEPEDAEACARVARELSLDFDSGGRISIDGAPGEPAIRGERVTRQVSSVAAHPEVRRAIVELQRAIAERSDGIVAEGRDTTTVVFPRADRKFYLDASREERARRRALELGRVERSGEVLAELERRDRLDSSRAHSPLVRAADAVVIDTEGRSVEQVVRAVLEHVRRPGGAR